MEKIIIDLEKVFSKKHISEYDLDKWSFYQILLSEPITYSVSSILEKFPGIREPLDTQIKNIYLIETNGFCDIASHFASEYFKKRNIRSNSVVLIPILDKLVTIPGDKICCCELHSAEEVDDSHYDYSIIQDPEEAEVPLDDLYIICTRTELRYGSLEKKKGEWVFRQEGRVFNKPSFFIGYN